VRLLLDTHVLLWRLRDDRRLKPPERRAIADAKAVVHVSAATVWEIAIKQRHGRCRAREPILERGWGLRVLVL
jgi:PIN domain nuclease of toxin-antitoxin system